MTPSAFLRVQGNPFRLKELALSQLKSEPSSSS